MRRGLRLTSPLLLRKIFEVRFRRCFFLCHFADQEFEDQFCLKSVFLIEVMGKRKHDGKGDVPKIEGKYGIAEEPREQHSKRKNGQPKQEENEVHHDAEMPPPKPMIEEEDREYLGAIKVSLNFPLKIPIYFSSSKIAIRRKT